MKNGVKYNIEMIRRFAEALRESMALSPTKEKALEKISNLVKTELGGYITPDILSSSDELQAGFIELLDQIVFETSENSQGENRIREYIFEDLYLRLSIYLDIFSDRDSYKRGLGSRMLTHEDTVIIKKYYMEEFIPLLMSEYYDQPALQKSILKALLAFDSEQLLNFYYQIAGQESCHEVKIFSLLGLKTSTPKFANWRHIVTDDERINSLIDYIKSFDLSDPGKNTVPGDLFSIFFVINYIELNASSAAIQKTADWMFRVFDRVSEIDSDSSLVNWICASVSTIIMQFGEERLREILDRDERLIVFLALIDFLPREYFNRITSHLGFLGEDFSLRISKLIESGRYEMRNGSNVSAYVYVDAATRL
jgi:hypothetical protein